LGVNDFTELSFVKALTTNKGMSVTEALALNNIYRDLNGRLKKILPQITDITTKKEIQLAIDNADKIIKETEGSLKLASKVTKEEEIITKEIAPTIEELTLVVEKVVPVEQIDNKVAVDKFVTDYSKNLHKNIAPELYNELIDSLKIE
jgi:hypothetical protein